MNDHVFYSKCPMNGGWYGRGKRGYFSFRDKVLVYVIVDEKGQRYVITTRQFEEPVWSNAEDVMLLSKWIEKAARWKSGHLKFMPKAIRL